MWPDHSDPLLGRTLGGKYVVESKLGSGGFGAVYRARQIPVGRPVAVKVAHPGTTGVELIRERFLREAHALARMRCRAVAMFFDFGEETDGLMYMVQEFVDGVTLSEVIKDGGRIPPLRAIDIACAVLEALAEAHGLGIVHRDIKPANIMLTRSARSDEQVKLLDFGLAKSWQDPDGQGRISTLTQENRIPGTPGYMAPEMWNQAPLTGATDLYALGVLLYRLVCGTLPFDAPSLPRLMQAHVNQPPPRPPAEIDVPAGLVAVIQRAMAKRPADRYPSAIEMDAALREALPDETARIAPLDEDLIGSFFADPQPESSASAEVIAVDSLNLHGGSLHGGSLHGGDRYGGGSDLLLDEPPARSPVDPLDAQATIPLPVKDVPAFLEKLDAAAPRPPPGATPTVARLPERRIWPLVTLFLVVATIVSGLIYLAIQPVQPDPSAINAVQVPKTTRGVEVITAQPTSVATVAPWSAPPATQAPRTASPTTRARRRRIVRRPKPKAVAAPATQAPTTASPAQIAAGLARGIRADLKACRCAAVPKRLKRLAAIDAGLHTTLRSQYQQSCQLIGVGCMEDP